MADHYADPPYRRIVWDNVQSGRPAATQDQAGRIDHSSLQTCELPNPDPAAASRAAVHRSTDCSSSSSADLERVDDPEPANMIR